MPSTMGQEQSIRIPSTNSPRSEEHNLPSESSLTTRSGQESITPASDASTRDDDWKHRYTMLNSQFSKLQQENYLLKRKVDDLRLKNEELERKLQQATRSTTSGSPSQQQRQQQIPLPPSVGPSTDTSQQQRPQQPRETPDDEEAIERKRRQEQEDREYALRLQREMMSSDEEDEGGIDRPQLVSSDDDEDDDHPMTYHRRPMSDDFPDQIMHRMMPHFASSPSMMRRSDDVMTPDEFLQELFVPRTAQQRYSPVAARASHHRRGRGGFYGSISSGSEGRNSSPLHPFLRLMTGMDIIPGSEQPSSYEELLRLDERAVRVGVPEQRLNQFPTHTFHARTQTSATSDSAAATTSSTETDQDDKCLICFEEYEEGDKIRTIPCMHKFHANCIDTWFREHHDCPICKFDVNE